MNLLEKARILGTAGHYDSCGPKMCEVKVENGLGGIYHARAEHKECRIFKTLMSNSCNFDCKYCENSSKCAKRKAAYEPEELGKLFNHLRFNLRVNGLFLSSGVSGNPDKVTEKMIEAVRIVRFKYRFRGYVHFKVLPGTSYEMVKQAAELSNRMSINLEAPSSGVLNELSSCKDFKIDILKRQTWIKKLKGNQATQMILNNLASDKDVLRMADWEYKKMELKRVYYSSFQPVRGTPLEKEKPESLIRQNRLYNADFLMREYSFKLKEFNTIMDKGMLPRQDPKLALALQYFDNPIDINEASFEDLIRVPGIGPKTAQRIVSGEKKILKYEDLHRLGGWVKRAKPFIVVDGKRQKRLSEF